MSYPFHFTLTFPFTRFVLTDFSLPLSLLSPLFLIPTPLYNYLVSILKGIPQEFGYRIKTYLDVPLPGRLEMRSLSRSCSFWRLSLVPLNRCLLVYPHFLLVSFRKWFTFFNLNHLSCCCCDCYNSSITLTLILTLRLAVSRYLRSKNWSSRTMISLSCLHPMEYLSSLRYRRSPNLLSRWAVQMNSSYAFCVFSLFSSTSFILHTLLNSFRTH